MKSCRHRCLQFRESANTSGNIRWKTRHGSSRSASSCSRRRGPRVPLHFAPATWPPTRTRFAPCTLMGYASTAASMPLCAIRRRIFASRQTFTGPPTLTMWPLIRSESSAMAGAESGTRRSARVPWRSCFRPSNPLTDSAGVNSCCCPTILKCCNGADTTPTGSSCADSSAWRCFWNETQRAIRVSEYRSSLHRVRSGRARCHAQATLRSGAEQQNRHCGRRSTAWLR